MDKERRTPRVGFSSTPKLEIQVSAKQEGDTITLVNSEYLAFHPQRKQARAHGVCEQPKPEKKEEKNDSSFQPSRRWVK